MSASDGSSNAVNDAIIRIPGTLYYVLRGQFTHFPQVMGYGDSALNSLKMRAKGQG
jgi:hypothetical protein